MRVSALSSVLAVMALLAAGPAFAEVVKLHATLDGKQQSPTLEVPGTGMADFSYDTDSKKLDWTVEYSGLTSPPAAGHLHGPAGPGENAGVAIPFEGDLTSPIKGSATLTDAQEADLLGGKYYVNLHTPANKGGEIRGQVEKAQ